MTRLTALFCTLLLLLTACAAPSSEASAISEEQPQESRTEASSSSEMSASEKPTQAPTPEPTPEPTPTPDPLAWYVPLETIPDFETYFATERYIGVSDGRSAWDRSFLYTFYLGENGAPDYLSMYLPPYEELSDHNLYRGKKEKPGKNGFSAELWAEGDFKSVFLTSQWIYIHDNNQVCWRMAYPDGELEKLCDLPLEMNFGYPYDNDLIMFSINSGTAYALYTPTGECFEMGPIPSDTTYFLPLTNRSYFLATIPEDEQNTEYQPGARYYIYSGTEGKVFEFDLEILGRQAVHDKNIPLAFPLDENGVPLHGGHLREVSLEEAGMAPGVSAADTDVVL